MIKVRWHRTVVRCHPIEAFDSEPSRTRRRTGKCWIEHDYSVSYASIRYHLKHQQDPETRPEDEAARSKLSRTS